MKNIFCSILATGTLLLSPFHQSFAQKDTAISIDATFQGERVNYLKDANKITTWPEIKEQEMAISKIQYSTLPTRKIVTIDPKPIMAAKINVDEKLARLYRGYFKAGYGSYFTPMVDAYYTDGRSKKGTFGLHYQHISSAGGVTPDDNDSIPDHYSDNQFDFWGKYFWTKTTLQGGLNWERNLTHWYGFDNKNDSLDLMPVDSMSLRQRLNTFGGNISYMTYARDTGDFNYNFDLSIRNTTDLFDGSETNVDWLAHGRKLIGNELFMCDIGVNYNSFSYFGPDMHPDGFITLDGELFSNRTEEDAIIRLVPMAQTIWNDIRVKVGMGLYVDARSDQTGHFYPLAEAAYSIADGLLVPYVGMRGGVEPVNYLGLYRENPFVQQFPDLRNRNNQFEFYGGFGGAISRAASFSIGFNHNTYGNFAFFVADSLYSVGNRFLMVYDNLSVLNLHGEVAVFGGEKWKANIRGDYYKYTTDQPHPWHQPNIKFTATAQYNLHNKFILGLDVFYVGARWTKSNVNVAGVEHVADGSYQYELDGFADINLKVEYRYNKRLSGWVQFNNMLANKYNRWGGYTNQRFLGMLGVTYGF